MGGFGPSIEVDFQAIGRRINCALRMRGDVKAMALAHRIGVSESAVSRWRHGSPLTLANVVALAAALDLSLDWLLSGCGAMDRASVRDRQRLAALDDVDPESLATVARLLHRLRSPEDPPAPRSAWR